jgi:hypothetical protein
VGHGDNSAFEKAKGDETLLAIGKSVVLDRDRVPFEEGLDADEIDAMLP